ncbi:MAG: flagellar hook-basal body complex protein, partial [Psychrosphaera sp.]|nr:flagellar hook-basal body complex protein [Psychrosphaera sp.]
MDRMLYVAASGAKQNLNAIAVRANNLANAATDGFKADMEQARSLQAFGEGLPTRVFAMTEIASQNFDDGALKSTGRDLDIAIEGKGWIVVQDAEGKEAFTRKGNLKITEKIHCMPNIKQEIMSNITQNFMDVIADLTAVANESGLTQSVNVTEGGRGGLEKITEEN